MPVGAPFQPIWGACPTDDERARIDQVKEQFNTLRSHVLALPPNRERSLALTHLEDSCMRAVRAILEGAPPTPSSSTTRT